jgi:hypothetical protein
MMRAMVHPHLLLAPLAVFPLLLLGNDPTKPAPKPADTPPVVGGGTGTPAAKPEAPEPVRGLLVNAPGAFDGLTLLAPLNSKDIHLVDLDGAVVHTWKTQQVPGAATYLLESGHLLRCGQEEKNPRFHGGGLGGRIQELDWDGNVVWEYELAGADLTQHHDVKRLPNGNLLLIAWEFHSADEARAHGRDADQVTDEGLWSDVVIEIHPTLPKGGDVVWKWRAWDHLAQDRDPKKPDFSAPRDQPGRIDINADHRYEPKEETAEARKKREDRERQMKSVGYAGGNDPQDDPPAPAAAPAPASAPAVASGGAKPDAPKAPKIESDWMHTNAIDWHPELDLILLSSPHLREIFVIDHSTTTAQAASNSGGRYGHGGDLLYRYGNPQNWGMGRNADERLFYQHNAQWLHDGPKGELHVLLFNNGAKRPVKEYSSVEEFVLPFDREHGFVRAADKPFGPAEPIWSYSDPDNFFSGFISGAQRLPNGNTLICAGASGRVFEVTSDKHIVWDYLSPLGGEVEPPKQGGKAPPKALFRATRIARDDPSLKH